MTRLESILHEVLMLSAAEQTELMRFLQEPAMFSAVDRHRPDVVHITDLTDYDRVFELVQDRIGVRPDASAAPLKGILAVLAELQCKSVLVGFPFRDQDYLYDYLHHFGASFYPAGKDCVRLHFFSGDRRLDPNDPLHDLVRFSEFGSRDYLGFMVVRPTGRYCVGRTLLRDPYERDGFVRVKHVYRCDAYGVDLTVPSAPFMEQDRSSHRCAGVALWSMCYDLHHRYHTPRLFPRQIDELARVHFPGADVGRGLSPDQIAYILRHQGCSSDVHTVRVRSDNQWDSDLLSQPISFEEVVDEIVGDLQSNLPVLVGYYPYDGEPHAVLAISHDYSKGLQPPRPERPNLISASATYLICQDDQVGPYENLPIWKNKDNNRKALEEMRKIVIIPGVTQAAYLTYPAARGQVLKELQILRYYVDTTCPLEMRKDTPDLFEKTYLRLYLQQSRRFRSQLLDKWHGRTELNECELIMNYYRSIPLPRFIYVCDFCVAQIVDEFGKIRYHIVGEMLLDATVPRFAQEQSVVALRIEDTIFRKVQNDWYEELQDPAYFRRPQPRRLGPLNLE